MRTGTPGIAITATLLCSVVQPCAQAQSLPAPLLDCSTEKDDARRLACYDREVARARESVPPAAAHDTAAVAGTAAAGTAAAGTASADDNFGKREDKPPEKKAVTATVTEVRSKPYGELVVTLDNGQVW